jgi:hypothetical protein
MSYRCCCKFKGDCSLSDLSDRSIQALWIAQGDSKPFARLAASKGAF